MIKPTQKSIAQKKAVKAREIATDGPGIAESVINLTAQAGVTASIENLYFDYLNDEQNIFLREYLTNDRDPLKAYRVAYTNNMSDAAARVKAYKMLDGPNIKVALASLERMAQASLNITLEDHIRELRALRDLAKAARQYSAAITAETNCGKAAGIYIQKVEHSGLNGGPIGVSAVPTDEYLRARQQVLGDV